MEKYAQQMLQSSIPLAMRTLGNLDIISNFTQAVSKDGGADFLGHLCQSQVPGGASTPGVSLLGVPAHDA